MKKLFTIIALGCLMAACAEHEGIVGNKQGQWPIQISSSYPSSEVTTRAVIDGGFVAGDEMGIFIVDRDENGEAGEVMIQGNRASNIRATLQEDGTWETSTPLYWNTKGNAADFYGYYPFEERLSSVTAYPFSVAARQDATTSTMEAAGYESSDLLWAKTQNAKPQAETVNLQYRHLMAGVTIRLEQGTGITDAEWATLKKTVLLRNLILGGTADLTTGTLTLGDGTPQDICPLAYNGEWRALVFPQTVDKGLQLVSITLDGQVYALTKTETMKFLSGKMHRFTIKIDRREASGDYSVAIADEAIVPWQDDAELHEGLVREYLVVEVSAPGKLAEDLVRLGQDYRHVESMKVIGDINQADLEFMGREMTQTINLNLQKVRIVADENGEGAGYLNLHRNVWDWANGGEKHKLTRCLFPEGITRIGGFTHTCLTGSLVIPEGVTQIDEHTFYSCDYNGTLTLPSTLKRIGESAFSWNRLTGELHLPEGLETIEVTDFYGVFEGCQFTGNLQIPKSLKKLFPLDCSKMSGTLVIPQGLKEVLGCFTSGGFDKMILPEGLISIDYGYGGNLSGEVVLPSTLERFGGFAGSKISGVVFPENLKIIGASAFQDCSRLQGTITIPKKVVKVPVDCFANCPMLTGVVFHKDIHVIEDRAFEMCENLNSIVCEGEEPPAVGEDVFLGVPKDNFTLEVPKGCVEKYRQARGWGDFKRIAEYSSFVCRPAQVQALNQRHSENLVLNAEGNWTVVEKPDWVTLSKESGTGKVTVTMTAQTLSHGAGNRQGDVVFRMEQDGKSYETRCHVSQYDYEYDEDGCLTLQKASKGNNGGIDIVFAGDGWDGASISDGSYLDLIRYQTECFFAIEPYRSMREYFNVYVTFPLSQEKGVNTMYTYVNNHFGTLYGISAISVGATSGELITESDEVQDYAVRHTPLKEEDLWRSLVILVPNTTEYEGHTEYTWDGKTLSICPPSERPYPRDTRGVMQHEAGGHGFGKLGDESFAINAFAPTTVRQYVEEMHQRGWFANLASTGKLSSVPWAEFIFDPVYSDYVDVYEGGYGYTRLIYRPEANSCMNYGIPYYNTPSRLDIWKRIKAYAGEEWSMEEFRAQDTFEWGPTEITRSAAMPDRMFTSGNHQMPTIVRFREVGDQVRKIREKVKVKK